MNKNKNVVKNKYQSSHLGNSKKHHTSRFQQMGALIVWHDICFFRKMSFWSKSGYVLGEEHSPQNIICKEHVQEELWKFPYDIYMVLKVCVTIVIINSVVCKKVVCLENKSRQEHWTPQVIIIVIVSKLLN